MRQPGRKELTVGVKLTAQEARAAGCCRSRRQEFSLFPREIRIITLHLRQHLTAISRPFGSDALRRPFLDQSAVARHDIAQSAAIFVQHPVRRMMGIAGAQTGKHRPFRWRHEQDRHWRKRAGASSPWPYPARSLRAACRDIRRPWPAIGHAPPCASASSAHSPRCRPAPFGPVSGSF